MFLQNARDERLEINELLNVKSENYTPSDFSYLTIDKKSWLCVSGLKYYVPICDLLLRDGKIRNFMMGFSGKLLLDVEKDCKFIVNDNVVELPQIVSKGIKNIVKQAYKACGQLDKGGNHIIDLKGNYISPHFCVNLLLGNRMDYYAPLFTTPKSVVDHFGRGSFRAGGDKQVLATKYTQDISENGEPSNRQFYITENGKQIFYSLDVDHNVKKAECVHSQNKTIIKYNTKCGLVITRTIFLLPQYAGLPSAVEAQYVKIENKTNKDRNLRIVFTGNFGLFKPETIVNDVVYASVVHQSEVAYNQDKPLAISLHFKDQALQNEKLFATVLCKNDAFDEYSFGINNFTGRGSLSQPESVAYLNMHHSTKYASFFALAKNISVKQNASNYAISFVGYSQSFNGDSNENYSNELCNLIGKYSCEQAITDQISQIELEHDKYCKYLQVRSKDEYLQSYVNNNLPFQVLYQTFVSRSFAWTQKAYRETGFREIQDIYASVYYLAAYGKSELCKKLISRWVENVFEMGYAYHDFTWKGKEPGDCSDDQLWLVQAIYRYISITGDYDFLNEEYIVAGSDKKRKLCDTLYAILVYSGKISVGIHGLPLLDKADWNDTLRLDKTVYKGDAKQKLYMQQLAQNNEQYGKPFKNTMSESVMNAFLLKIAADQSYEMAGVIGNENLRLLAQEISGNIESSIQQNCWKNKYFCRALINDDRRETYPYLGSYGDNLNADKNADGTYFLNSYSWSLLSEVATEEQVEKMVQVIEDNLVCKAGIKLCTIVDFSKIGINTPTALYYPGDRENGGVFKHAEMMCVVASLKYAKKVKSDSLRKRLYNLAAYALEKTLPYKTMVNPYVIKGNPRFCTQYNNSITGENVGPILSGTSSWLSLAIYEKLGIQETSNRIIINPITNEDIEYTINSCGTEICVKVISSAENLVLNSDSVIIVDGKKSQQSIITKDCCKHMVEIYL